MSRRRSLFGNRKTTYDTPNLFVGNVAGLVYTAEILANKLYISESDILDFNIIENDIEAIIDVNFTVPYGPWRSSDMRIMTSFEDDGMCESVGTSAFQDVGSIKRMIFPNATSISNYAFRRCSSSELIYIPNATQLGVGVFNSIKTGTTICCHPSLATSNDGSRDVNIAYAEDTRGATIIYGADETLLT